MDAPDPKIVAIIGASNDRRKFGNKALRAFVRQGYTAIPINPHEQDVEGHRAFPSVLDVPGPVHMATFYVPPEVGERVIEEVARKGVAEVWFNPGSESRALLSRAETLGLRTVVACSIIGIGDSPSRY